MHAVSASASPNLTTAETAERLHTTPGRLANIRCQGLGPAYFKFGSRVLYRLSDVEAFEQAHIVQTHDSARLVAA